MSTATEERDGAAVVASQSLAKMSPFADYLSVVDKLRETYGIVPDTATKTGYEQARVWLGELVKLRTSIEKRRKEAKADALEYGRRLDNEAKKLTMAVEEVEEPIRAAKSLIDDEKERVRKEKEDAERKRVEAEREAELADERQRLAEERARQEAEAARLKAENDRLAAERKKIEDEQRAIREKAEAEQRAAQAKLDEERRKLEREEFERQAKIKAEQEARDKLERERLAAEKRVQEQKAAEAEAKRLADEERARLEALRPDVEKIKAFAASLRALEMPAVNTKTGRAFVLATLNKLGAIATSCEQFAG